MYPKRGILRFLSDLVVGDYGRIKRLPVDRFVGWGGDCGPMGPVESYVGRVLRGAVIVDEFVRFI